MFSRWGPERRGVEPRLSYSATTTLSGPSDAIFGDAVSLRHACGGGGEPPTQRCRRGYELGRVVAIETLYVVPIASEVLHGSDGMESGFSRLGGRLLATWWLCRTVLPQPCQRERMGLLRQLHRCRS